MSDPDSKKDPEKSGELKIRPLEEVIPRVENNSEMLCLELEIPTKAEIEQSPDARLACVMATPMLSVEEFVRKTTGCQAVLFCAFASGALPDRLTPVIQQR